MIVPRTSAGRSGRGSRRAAAGAFGPAVSII